jgi:integrase
MCIRLCEYLEKKKLLDFNYADLGQLGIKKEIIDEYKEVQNERERTRKKIWSNEDIQKFYDAYRTNTGGEIVNIMLFMNETGVRPGEFEPIKISDIDLEKRELYIDKAQALRYKDAEMPEQGVEYYTKVTKTKEERIVYLSDFALELVHVMMEQTKSKAPLNPNNLLYPSFKKGNKKRSNSSMEIGVKELCDKLGVDRDVRMSKGGQKRGLSLYTCRHT